MHKNKIYKYNMRKTIDFFSILIYNILVLV